MSGKIFDAFDEYFCSSEKRNFMLAGDQKNWTSFKVYVFSKEDVDLVEKLNKLNSLLVSHNMSEYGKFSVCLDCSLLPDSAFTFPSKNINKKQ